MIDKVNILFSIVIPTYNRANLLKRCLNSIISQTYPNWEAIVVDNYSDDNTEKIVKTFNDDRIKFVKNHNHGIISISRNKALDMAKGDWICFLDSDDSWFPNKLEEISKYTGKYDLIYHGCLNNVAGGFFKRKKNYFYKISQPKIEYVLQRGDPINPSCSAISKSTLGNTRFSEEKNLSAVEDYDFFLQIIAKHENIKILRLKKILTNYDVSTGISHSRKALDRDRKIIIKYRDWVTSNDMREIIKYYYLRKAEFITDEQSIHQLFKCYRIAMSAKAFNVKRGGFVGLIKTTLLLFRTLIGI